MTDYRIQDMRFTMIIVRTALAGGREEFERLPFDLVRYDVDVNPSAPQFIIGAGNDFVAKVDGGGSESAKKRYERIWIVDQAPFKAVQSGTGGPF